MFAEVKDHWWSLPCALRKHCLACSGGSAEVVCEASLERTHLGQVQDGEGKAQGWTRGASQALPLQEQSQEPRAPAGALQPAFHCSVSLERPLSPLSTPTLSHQALSLREAERSLLRGKLSEAAREVDRVRQEAQRQREQAQVSPPGPLHASRPTPPTPSCTLPPGPRDTSPFGSFPGHPQGLVLGGGGALSPWEEKAA